MKKFVLGFVLSLLFLSICLSTLSNITKADVNDNIWIGVTTDQSVTTNPNIHIWDVKNLSVVMDNGVVHYGSNNSENLYNNAIGFDVTLGVVHYINLTYIWNSTYVTTRDFGFTVNPADSAHDNLRWITIPNDTNGYPLYNNWGYSLSAKTLVIYIEGPSYSILNNVAISLKDPISFIYSVGYSIASIVQTVIGWNLHPWSFTIGMVIIFGIITSLPLSFVGGSTYGGGVGFRAPPVIFGRSSGGHLGGLLGTGGGWQGGKKGRTDAGIPWGLVALAMMIVGAVVIFYFFLYSLLMWIGVGLFSVGGFILLLRHLHYHLRYIFRKL